MSNSTDSILSEVADGVFAYVQPDGGWCLNNAGLVVGGGTSVLIDNAATQRRAEQLRDAVLRVAPAPGVVVNTHFHGDHHFGNARFLPATIVAHETARAQIIEAGLGLRALWPGVDWGDTPVVPPTLTFSDRLTLHAGEERVELLHVGPAHTSHDVVAWVPGRRVLFTGDVVMSGVTPFCLMGTVTGSLRALDRLRALEPAVVVPGHGAVGGPELFAANAAYLGWILDVARAGVAAGRTPFEAAAGVAVNPFADLIDPERVVGNLHSAYVDLGAAPAVDLAAAFAEMVAYHGGLPHCAA